PQWVPIRGGTDGSRLTEMGLPTPNLFTGGYNFHSVTEFLVIEENEQATATLVELASLWGE
ncbi:MAG: peptidase T, partial [Thermoguttaceae bacterium]